MSVCYAILSVVLLKHIHTRAINLKNVEETHSVPLYTLSQFHGICYFSLKKSWTEMVKWAGKRLRKAWIERKTHRQQATAGKKTDRLLVEWFICLSKECEVILFHRMKTVWYKTPSPSLFSSLKEFGHIISDNKWSERQLVLAVGRERDKMKSRARRSVVKWTL